jgi:3',5'-cyclic AMP phosphodiesterase CpdA
MGLVTSRCLGRPIRHLYRYLRRLHQLIREFVHANLAGVHTTITCVCISDTHSRHASLADVPTGDILIHAGDLTDHGTIDEILDFFAWFLSQPHQHKVFVAGNHDHSLEPGHIYRSALRGVGGQAVGRVAETEEESRELISRLKADAQTTYLDPSDPYVSLEVRGRTVNVYGLPCSPLSFGPSAFMRDRNLDVWSDTPSNTDIMISHSPPRGILDRLANGKNQGCQSLKRAIEKIKPKLVVCGHVHEARGVERIAWNGEEETVVVNAAVMGRSKEVECGAQVISI